MVSGVWCHLKATEGKKEYKKENNEKRFNTETDISIYAIWILQTNTIE